MVTKNAIDIKNCTLDLVFTKNARTSWGLILKSLSSKKQLNILLPSYIGFTEREGSGVFDPVIQYSCKFNFYRVGEKLEVDLQDLERKLIDKNVDVLLVIHYFGFCQNDMPILKSLCQREGVILVEDCAHAFYLEEDNQKLGNFGDFSFYSLHKYIATKTGGILKSNTKEMKISSLLSSEKIDCEVLEQYIRTDFKRIANIRKTNYKTYMELLPLNKNIEIIYNLEADTIPQTFPVRIKNGLREKLYFYLIEQEIITTALYYRLIKEIDKDQFPISFNIAEEILNLPVHQDTTLDDIKSICANIESFFSLYN